MVLAAEKPTISHNNRSARSSMQNFQNAMKGLRFDVHVDPTPAGPLSPKMLDKKLKMQGIDPSSINYSSNYRPPSPRSPKYPNARPTPGDVHIDPTPAGPLPPDCI